MGIRILVVTVPGHSIVHDDPEWAGLAHSILEKMVGQFYRANLTLNLHLTAREIWERDATVERRRAANAEFFERVEAVEQVIRQERGLGEPFARVTGPEIVEMHREAMLRSKQELWREGWAPNEFSEYEQGLHAESFVLAVNEFGQFLKKLQGPTYSPQEAKKAQSDFVKRFPSVEDIRNTMGHQEDRALGFKKGGKPLNLDADHAALSGRVLGIGNLIGSEFGATTNTGNYRGVDVSIEALRTLRQVLHRALRAFEWRGEPVHYPSLGTPRFSQVDTAGRPMVYEVEHDG